MIHGTINGDIIATQRLELGRAAKVNGNIQTPSLVIEQGAIFEGSCKMLQMSSVAEKNKKKLEEQPLEKSNVQPITTDGTKKATDIPGVASISNIAS
jgi:cytoskeletal protein CcmA (bactofilin family)